MSEHNTGCGIQHELLFHPTELYEFGPYSFLSRYNCRVGMSRCDPLPLARFVSRNECRRLLDISPSKKISLTLETEDSLFHFCLAAKKKETIALSVDGKVDDLY